MWTLYEFCPNLYEATLDQGVDAVLTPDSHPYFVPANDATVHRRRSKCVEAPQMVLGNDSQDESKVAVVLNCHLSLYTGVALGLLKQNYFVICVYSKDFPSDSNVDELSDYTSLKTYSEEEFLQIPSDELEVVDCVVADNSPEPLGNCTIMYSINN